VRQAKSGQSHGLKGVRRGNSSFTTVANRAACRSIRSNPSAEALEGEGVSRNNVNPFRPRYTKSTVAKLPELLKPVTGEKGNEQVPRRAVRGDWGRRALKDWSRNLGDPTLWVEPNANGKT
jgi:hypothetical protein